MFDFMDFDGAGAIGEFETPSGPNVPEAIDCMRCGMCLNSCPTYQLTGDEQEGPRQRIRTLSRLVVEQQEVDAEAIAHLQNCVQCRACEAACPSQMGYGELFDQAQAKLEDGKKRSVYASLALALVAKRQWMNAFTPLVWFYQVSGLRYWLRKLKVLDLLRLSRVDNLAPMPVLHNLKPSYPVADAKGVVALFTGCISDRFDRETLLAAVEVLNRIGYSVLVPAEQQCCGAIHYHNGDRVGGEGLMKQNIDIFSMLSVDAIVYCATGCGSQLQEFERLFTDDDQTPPASSFSDKLFEICDFVDRKWPQEMSLQPGDARVLVHEPCTQRNVLKNEQAVYRLLRRIPCIDVAELEENHLCCGAGGSYMLTHPENADNLRDRKWRHVLGGRADVLVTANIGCALHLAAASKRKESVDIVHPIRLIADRMR